VIKEYNILANKIKKKKGSKIRIMQQCGINARGSATLAQSSDPVYVITFYAA